MALVKRNNNMALIASEAGKIAAVKAGQVMLSPAGRELIWNGVNWVRKKLSRAKRNDVILHPGVMPGAVAAPVANTRILRASKPKFTRSKGSVTISHRELLGQFNNSSGLVVNGGVTGNLYRLSPSNPVVFPWLQGIAASFDQYKFDRVQLQYVPMCATTETGRVAIYFDKDSQDVGPADRIELANMAHLTESAPWCESTLSIPVDNIKRFMNDNSTTDPKLVDLGQIGLATYGGGSTNAVGDLFIHYTITLFEPQPLASLIETEQTGIGAAPFGTNLVTVSGNATTTTITFRGPGVYMLALSQRAASFTTFATAGGAAVNSHTTLFSGPAYQSIMNITATIPGGSITYSGTLFGNYTLQVVRAKVSNNATLI
uniref:Capsid protein n=1 Tax=Pothos latent virus TaxID=44562 RepID=A0A0S3QNV6_9TOMB|nr:coat protein [Pothos latent virus]